jgi:pimeloyl-ACP methyl ester carboxylesterase
MIPMFRRSDTILGEALLPPSPHAPQIWGDFAFRRFCTPHLSRHRSTEHDVLVERARFHLRHASAVRVGTSQGNIQAYVFEPDGTDVAGTVLCVHGWTGEAAFMAAFAEHLRKRAFRAVLFDLPAHGRSSGRHTSLIACAHAVREVAEALGPMRFAVAHSLGGLAALVAGGGAPPMSRAYPFQAYVLVAVPNRFSEVTHDFSEELGLSPAARRVYERHLERLAHRKIAEFTGARLLAETSRSALFLHARDDAEVPFRNAEEIVACCPVAELQAFEGLGHRKILYAPPVVRAATSYLLRQVGRAQPGEAK